MEPQTLDVQNHVGDPRTYEILGHAFTSYLPPWVTHGMVSRDADDMTARGYDTVTIEGFGNVWTKTTPPAVEKRATA